MQMQRSTDIPGTSHNKGRQLPASFQPEFIKFGNIPLQSFPTSNLSFKTLPHISVSEEQKCLLDNLWIAKNKFNSDPKYFHTCMNALAEHFNNYNTRQNYKYYTVVQGYTKGVFSTWTEVLDSIRNFKNPLYKGFENISDAFSLARHHLGPNYYISPTVKTTVGVDKTLSSPMQTAIGKDTSNPLMAVNLPKIQEKAINEAISLASPVEQVAGKGLSNPVMGVAFPKSQDERESGDNYKQLVSIIQKIVDDTLIKRDSQNTTVGLEFSRNPELLHMGQKNMSQEASSPNLDTIEPIKSEESDLKKKKIVD